MNARIFLLLGLASAAATAAAADKALSIADFMRDALYDDLSLSPDGRYFAARVPQDGGSTLAVLSRDTLAVTARVTPGYGRYVMRHAWIGPTRVIMTSGAANGASPPGEIEGIKAVNADGKDIALADGRFVDVVRDGTGNLVAWYCSEKCKSGAYVRVNGRTLEEMGGRMELPEGFWTAALDRKGNPLVAWGDGKDEDLKYEVVVRDGQRWRQVHDEADAQLARTPLGVAADGDVWYLTETRRGPSLIERRDAETGKSAPILRHERVDPSNLIWSRDHDEIVGAWFHDGKPEALFVLPDAPEARITAQIIEAFPDAWPRVVDYSEDGRLALAFVSSDVEPGRYYLLDTTTQKLTFVIATRPWIDPAQMARKTPFRIKARDGVELSGTLTLPRSGRAPWPLVVRLNSFPGARQWWSTFDGLTQMFASRGMAVLEVDARGSPGYGRAFEKDKPERAGAMQDDIADATRWAIAAGHASKDRICIEGTGYGGHAALLAVIREPGLYRCAVATNGIYDLERFFRKRTHRASDAVRELAERELGADAGTRARNSPALRAGEIRVPVLIADEFPDFDYFGKQFKPMKKALDAAHVRYEAFAFDENGDEGDSLHARATAYAWRMLSFLERNLEDPAP